MATTTQVPGEPGGNGADEVTLAHTPEGKPIPPLRYRFTPPFLRSDVAWGWVAPLIVTVFVSIFQFWGLTSPHKITFDETYYAKDSYSLLIHQHARNFVNDPDTDASEADQIINSGSTKDIFAPGPSKVVHPDVGKWMIAVGEWMFGMNPLGWRFSAALVGTLMILVMCRLVRRLTGSTLLGCIAGLLLGFDGLHFVMSRLALLDIFLAFWLLCAAHCLIADRDWARRKLARMQADAPPGKPPWGSRPTFGPIRGFLFRPWRLLAGICFGLACGTKWNGLFVLAAFGLLTWAWDSGRRRALGVRLAPLKSMLADAVPSFFSIVVVAFVVYVASWGGFLAHAQSFEDAFGHAANKEDWTWSSVDDFGGNPQGWTENTLHNLDILWNYHIEVYDFHTGDYLKNATHPYMSNPSGWLLINRPLGVAVTTGSAHPGKNCEDHGGCTTMPNCPEGHSCVRQVLAIGTPILWWGGVGALIIGAGFWLFKRDWRFGLPMLGVLVTWLPWVRYDDRPIFYYYAIATIPFTVIVVTLVLGKILGRKDAPRPRRMLGVVTCVAFVLAVAVNFWYFYPILANQLITNAEWNDRMWLVHWI